MRSMLILMLATVLPLANVNALGSPAAGKIKSQTCAACHGADGNSPIATNPNLAGQNVNYFVKQLRDYQEGPNGPRYNAVMASMVANLSAQDIEDLAAYYSIQKINVGQTPAQYVDLGQKIYQGGIIEKGIPACAACHSPNGFGNSQAGISLLSGQHAEYIQAQMLAFKSGQRHNSTNGVMNVIAAKMSEAEITAVSHYVQGLH